MITMGAGAVITVAPAEPCTGCGVPVSVVTSTRAGVVEQTGRYRIDEDGIGAILLLAHTPQVCRWWATKQAAS